MIRPSLSRHLRIPGLLERLTGIAIGFVLFEGAILYIDQRLFPLVAHLPFRPGTAILFLASINYGLFRATAFHPAFQGDYRTWLESTPWTSRKPLPMGPLELVWEDGLFLVPLILLAATLPEPHAVPLLCAFLLAHLLGLSFSFLLTRTRAPGYATAFGLGLAVWLWRQPTACLVAATLVYLIAYEGLWQALRSFPWKPWKWPKPSSDLWSMDWLREDCGWPYDRMLGEVIEVPAISRIDALLGCMLGSWWLYVLASLFRDPKDKLGLLLLAGLPAAFSSLGRLIIYGLGYVSPISFWARIWTFRWIIPGYDQIFVAPLCSPLAGVMTGALLYACGLPLEVCLPPAYGVAVLVALVTPPRLRRWRLTGQHRLVPVITTTAGQKYVQVG